MDSSMRLGVERRRRAGRVNRLARAFVSTVSVDKPYYTALLAKLICQTANDSTGGNLETCKTLIVRDILPSWTNLVALCRFLECLAETFAPELAGSTTRLGGPQDDPFEWAGLALDINGEQKQPPPAATRRTNLCAIISEVLVYCSTRARADATFSKEWATPRVMDLLKRVTIRLFRLAACRADLTEIRHNALPLWELHNTFHDTFKVFDLNFTKEVTLIFHWGETMTHSQAVAQNIGERIKARQLYGPYRPYSRADNVPAHLPRRHSVKGSPNAPWHQLPAANGLYMASTRGHPLRAGAFPKEGYELRSGGQQADPALTKDVQNLHQEMLYALEDFTDPSDVQDIGPLGNKIWKDPERPTRNYWGFSYEGLEKMKQNRKKFREQAKGYGDVAPMMGYGAGGGGAMDDVNAAVARARELAASRGFGDRGRGRGGRGGGGGWRGGNDRGRGGYRGRGPRQW